MCILLVCSAAGALEALGQTTETATQKPIPSSAEENAARAKVQFRRTAPQPPDGAPRREDPGAARSEGTNQTSLTRPFPSPTQAAPATQESFHSIQENFSPATSVYSNGTVSLNPNSPLINPNRILTPDVSADHGDYGLNLLINPARLFGETPLLRRGPSPEDSTLKIGPIYLNVTYASAEVLATDNANLTETHREAGAIAISELGFQMIAQLTETLQFAATGALVYYPTKNKVGVITYGATPLNYGLDLQPPERAMATLRWTVDAFGWPITVLDQLGSVFGTFTFNPAGDSALFLGNSFDAEDSLGRYSFRTVQSGKNTGFRATDPVLRDENADLSYYYNELSVATERLLPGEIRLRAFVFHENLWYNQDRRGLPDLRDGAVVALTEEREDLRFKPFLLYKALRDSYTRGFDQTIYVGLSGPIDDQLFLFAEGGYFFNPNSNYQTALWKAELDHDAGPFTREDFTVERTTTYFDDSIETSAIYRLHQVLGPRLTGTVFARYSEYEDLLRQYGKSEIFSTGIQLTYDLGPRTRAIGQLIYDRDHGAENATAWIGRLILSYQFTESFTGSLLYQYTREDAHGPSVYGPSYTENLAILRLTKWFR